LRLGNGGQVVYTHAVGLVTLIQNLIMFEETTEETTEATPVAEEATEAEATPEAAPAVEAAPATETPE